MKTTGPPEI